MSEGLTEKGHVKVLEGNNCFISLPTAYDKCLIFLVLLFAIKYLGRYDDNPPTSSDEYLSVIFVISPLPVLIDQYKALYGNVVASVFWGTKYDISPNVAEKSVAIIFDEWSLLFFAMIRLIYHLCDDVNL